MSQNLVTLDITDPQLAAALAAQPRAGRPLRQDPPQGTRPGERVRVCA